VTLVARKPPKALRLADLFVNPMAVTTVASPTPSGFALIRTIGGVAVTAVIVTVTSSTFDVGSITVDVVPDSAGLSNPQSPPGTASTIPKPNDAVLGQPVIFAAPIALAAAPTSGAPLLVRIWVPIASMPFARFSLTIVPVTAQLAP
jgi:hypothetical protein